MQATKRRNEMARAAEHQTIIDDSIDTPVGYDKKKLWDACYAQWIKEWKQKTTCRMTKIFFPHPDKNKTPKTWKSLHAQAHWMYHCTRGGKLGPHKEDPALCPYGCDGCTKRGPFPNNNKQCLILNEHNIHSWAEGQTIKPETEEGEKISHV